MAIIDPTRRCPHCPDGHGTPHRTAWGVWVAQDVDADGQPIYIRVQPTAGAHVAEEDAEWLRYLLRLPIPWPLPTGEVPLRRHDRYPGRTA
jgi:hypothetical protein